MFEEVKKELSHTPVQSRNNSICRCVIVWARSSSPTTRRNYAPSSVCLKGDDSDCTKIFSDRERSFGDDMVSGEILRLPVWDPILRGNRPSAVGIFVKLKQKS